jgi:hypothetical protein
MNVIWPDKRCKTGFSGLEITFTTIYTCTSWHRPPGQVCVLVQVSLMN